MKPVIEKMDTLSLVKEIAERMKNPEYVKQIIVDPKNQNPNPVFHQIQWDDLSISGGYSSLLLLHSQLDQLFPEEKWDAAAHAYVLKIKEVIELKGFHSLSLYGGLTGVCFSIQQASRNGTRYQKLLSSLNQLLFTQLEKTYLLPIRENLETGRSSSPSLYDLIQGIVGIGLYGLKNLTPEFLPVVEEMVRLTVRLTEPIKIENTWVPGWHFSREHQFLEQEKQAFPKGNFNLGLAHGVPGLMGFLALALLHGINVEGIKEGITRVAEWLKQWRRELNGIDFWDSNISFEEQIAGRFTESRRYSRQAWCYGTPGVARSLYIAGVALQNSELKQFALDSFCDLFLKNPKDWNLPGPTFCHGISGLLMITYLMARDTHSSFIEEKVKYLERTLLEFYRPEIPFGFRDFEPSKDGSYVEIDRASILEGSQGVLLTLLSLHCPKISWHLPFLIDT